MKLRRLRIPTAKLAVKNLREIVKEICLAIAGNPPYLLLLSATPIMCKQFRGLFQKMRMGPTQTLIDITIKW